MSCIRELAQRMCIDAGDIWADHVARGRWIGRAVIAVHEAKLNEAVREHWQDQFASDEYFDRFGTIP